MVRCLCRRGSKCLGLYEEDRVDKLLLRVECRGRCQVRVECRGRCQVGLHLGFPGAGVSPQ